MFDLERAVAEWRRQMSAGIKTTTSLDELESHLREDFRAMVLTGKSENESFELAISRLGGPDSLWMEFNKLKSPTWWPVKIGFWLFAGALVLMTLRLSRSVYDGILSLLLFAHILTVTAGYGAALLTGGLGVIYVCARMLNPLSAVRRESLDRGALWGGQVAAAMVIVGFVLGMVWCKQHRGKFLLGDMKEVGAILVVIWFAALAVAQRRWLIGERTTMLMRIAGNIIVSLAWFGAGILDARNPGYWPLALSIFLGIHFIFLIMGIAPLVKGES